MHSCNNYTNYNSWIISQQAFFPFPISSDEGSMKMSHKMSLENGSGEINPKRIEFSDTSPASVIINWRPVGHIQPAKASHLACRTVMYSEKGSHLLTSGKDPVPLETDHRLARQPLAMSHKICN